MKLPLRTGVAAAAAVLAVVLAIGGCSSNSGTGAGKSGTSATTSNGDAATLLKSATDAMRKVTGMHLSLAVSGNVPNLRVTKLDGDVSNTPQTVATGNATLLLGNSPQDAKFVYVDGHLYSDLGQPGTYTDFGNGASPKSSVERCRIAPDASTTRRNRRCVVQKVSRCRPRSASTPRSEMLVILPARISFLNSGSARPRPSATIDAST